MRNSTLFLLLLSLSLKVIAQMPTNGLVAWYKFDGNANDASVNNNHGAMLNGATCSGVKDRFGKSNKAIHFDGIDDIVQVPNSISLNIGTNEFTVAFWVYIDAYIPAPCVASNVRYAGVFSKGGSAITNGYSLEFEPTANKVNVNFVSTNLVGNPPTFKQISTNSPTKKKWTHIALAFKNNLFAFYKDGHLIYLQPADVNPFGINGLDLTSTAPLIIGNHGFSCNDFLRGRLDDFIIYNRALSPQEIGKIRNQHTPRMVAKGHLPHKKAGDPVDIATGAYIHQEQDLTMGESNMNIPFIRSYNSSQSDKAGQFGYGWRHSLEYNLDKSDSAVWIIHYAEGGESYHIPDSTQTIFNPMYASSHDSLYKSGSNYVLVNLRDKTKLIFDGNGNITSVQDINGNNYIYGVTSQRKYSFTYNGAGKITSVSDPLGRVVTYAYTAAGDLATATLNGKTMAYTYDANHHLLTITDPNNMTSQYPMLTNHYDAQGRVDWQEDIYYNHTSFFYYTGHTTVYNPMMNSHIYYYDPLLLLPTEEIDELGHHSYISYNDNYSGDIDTLKDELGRITSFSSDINGNETTITNAMGYHTTVSYSPNNHPTDIIDAMGISIHIIYNTNGNPIQIDLPNNTHIYTNYGTKQLPINSTDAMGYTTNVTYNSHGDLATLIDAAGHTTTFTSDAVGRLTSITDANNHTTSFQYNELDQITLITNPMGYTIQHIYDDNGNLTGKKDKMNHWTYYTYDLKDNLIQIEYPDGNYSFFTYDNMDMLMSVFDQRGVNVVSYMYDARMQVISETTPAGMTSYEYDAVGNLVKITNALMQKTNITYDALNRPTIIIDNMGNTTHIIYNANGQTTQVIFPNNTTRSYTYNNMGWLMEVTDALQGKSTFQYNNNGRVTQVSDAMNRITNYTYTVLNQVSSMQDAGGIYTYTYNNVGNPITYTDANGITSTFTYNTNDELTHIAYSNGKFENYVLNANGEVNSESNNNGNITYVRNIMGMITKITDMFGNQTKYEYDQVGNPLKIIYPNNDSTQYWRDDNAQITNVFFNQDFIAKYHYNELGQVTKDSLQNGRYSLYQYDGLSRLISKMQYTATATLFAKNQYTLSNMGYITSDNATLPMQPNIPNTITTSSLVYRPDNGQISASGNIYGLDNNGNCVSSIGASTEAATFIQKNLLQSLTRNGVTSSFLYDNDGDKVSQIVNGQTTRYINDNFLGLSTPIEERTATNQLKVSYILGPGGVPIARDSAGTRLFYHHDAKGNTLALSNLASNITDTYAYDIFGDYALHTGSTQQPFQYLGGYGIQRQIDNIYYIRARYYDAEQGRFLSKDPITGAAGNTQARNQYVYGFDNSLMWNDASGMNPLKDISYIYKSCTNKKPNAFGFSFNTSISGAAGIGGAIVSSSLSVVLFTSGKYAWQPIIYSNLSLGVGLAAEAGISGGIGVGSFMGCKPDNKGITPQSWTGWSTSIFLSGTIHDVIGVSGGLNISKGNPSGTNWINAINNSLNFRKDVWYGMGADINIGVGADIGAMGGLMLTNTSLISNPNEGLMSSWLNLLSYGDDIVKAIGKNLPNATKIVIFLGTGVDVGGIDWNPF